MNVNTAVLENVFLSLLLISVSALVLYVEHNFISIYSLCSNVKETTNYCMHDPKYVLL